METARMNAVLRAREINKINCSVSQLLSNKCGTRCIFDQILQCQRSQTKHWFVWKSTVELGLNISTVYPLESLVAIPFLIKRNMF